MVMIREKILTVLLLLAVVGLAVQLIYSENKPPVHDVVSFREFGHNGR